MTLGVRAACFDEQGRVFLVRHAYVPGWYMPGGGVERHETTLDALEKELREEGNLVIVGQPELKAVFYNTGVSARDHVVFYRCVVRQAVPKVPDREIIESGFFNVDDLPAETTEATARRLDELAGRVPFDTHW